ncbi:MAG: hypothetical protein AMXMBFR33_16900 [Candidatus Xenobia bacterium]
MRVHVSLHDVSPVFEAEVEAALDLCQKVGARPALLVVPNYHGRSPLREAPAYCQRLRSLQSEGHEIYLHGYLHRCRSEAGARGDGRPGPLRRLIAQRVVSAGEAEFSDLSRQEAAERLDRGLADLREVGLRIDGFVPPAWSMPGWVHGLLAERRVGFTEDHFRVVDPTSGSTRLTVLLNYASRTRLRLYSTVCYCRLARYAGWLLPARIAIHPQDLRVPLLQREIVGLLNWAAGRLVHRGRDLLG